MKKTSENQNRRASPKPDCFQHGFSNPCLGHWSLGFGHFFLVHLLLVAFVATPALAQDVDYTRDVKPILKERCYACHAALKQESGLRLDTASFIRKGGDGGLVIERNKAAAESGLAAVRRAAERHENLMPPLIAAVKCGCTVGEISDVYREVFGVYRDPAWI